MAKSGPALRRRRGTKSRSGGIFGDVPMVQVMFMVTALLAVGLIGGLTLGFMGRSNSGPVNGYAADNAVNAVNAGTAVNADSDVAKKAANLRAGDPAASGAAAIDSHSHSAVGLGVDVTGMSLEQRNEAFMAHTPEIGTKGVFPYYPDSGKLVHELQGQRWEPLSRVETRRFTLRVRKGGIR